LRLQHCCGVESQLLHDRHPVKHGSLDRAVERVCNLLSGTAFRCRQTVTDISEKGKPVRVNGELVNETEYDSNLLMFLLKAYDRKRFGDKSQVDVKFPTRIEDLP
jgi:hypothetical protein